MKWQDVQDFFEWDGSLRDLYVQNTTRDDWQNVLRFIVSGSFDHEFSLNGQPVPLSDALAREFFGPRRENWGLRINVDGVSVMSHFFTEEEIEFDIDPRDVRTEADFASLLRFMRDIANLLGKSIRLTPENMSQRPLIEIDPLRLL